MSTFTVDTQLFRELGELLVGRESTALVELIKNAYDADATAVSVEGRDLDDPERGRIIITDNGYGMGPDEFQRGFLTIASRMKSGSERRSPVFGRRYTGEKGIGRLALHKLARKALIVSRKWNGESPILQGLPSDGRGVNGFINWDMIERCSDLAAVDRSHAVTKLERTDRTMHRAGTRIVLGRLRKAWTPQILGQFLQEVATLIPPPLLTSPLPAGMVPKHLLFENVRTRDASPDGASGAFELELLGDLSPQDSRSSLVLEKAHWVLEIDCSAEQGVIRFAIEPTKRFREAFPEATPQPARFKLAYPEDAPTVSFKARILQITTFTWPSEYQGVRLYMEGFRVLPYGEPDNDWLFLNYEYTNRAARELLPGIPDHLSQQFPGLAGESGVIQPNKAYFGGVFLTHEGAPELKMLVNREGFLPGPAIEFIRKQVKLGIDLLVRQRYAATNPVKIARREEATQRKAAATAPPRHTPSSWRVQESLKAAKNSMAQARVAAAQGDIRAAVAAVEEAWQPVATAEQLAADMGAESAMFRVLASVGTELAAFSHEVNGLVDLSIGLTGLLAKLRETEGLPSEARARLSDTAAAAFDLRHALERQAIYLRDLVSLDARRRRSRQGVRERFEAALRVLTATIEKRGITVENKIPDDIRMLPVFPAEPVAVFTNLLTNAIKAAGAGGRILASAWEDENDLVVRLENTGVAVDLAEAAKWFEPFQSTTTSVEPGLGQGMGLGLTITRSIVEEYGGTIRFVSPSPGYATALEFRLPQR